MIHNIFPAVVTMGGQTAAVSPVSVRSITAASEIANDVKRHAFH